VLHQVIPLGDEHFASERGPLSLLTSIPVRRLDISVGKFDLADYFDVNSVGGDSHMQFMNWTIVNNGAFDYAADTRGYTWGGVTEYGDRYWAFRFAEALLSKRANGLALQKNLQRAHSENFELEFRPTIIEGRTSALRLLAFTNYANMGDYRVAIDNFLEGKTPTPEIDDHPQHTTLKYGFGINGEQEFTGCLRGFFRAGWNEGQHESWSYTEVNQSAAIGGDVRGTPWKRPQDKLGLAFAINGISRSHREYLGLGGLGFVLGDGRLNYAPEKIVESYYNFPIPIYHGFYGAVDLQYIDDPGYNRDRGPVIVPSLRLHVEL
jgi:high affinity Mn2+ porin